MMLRLLKWVAYFGLCLSLGAAVAIYFSIRAQNVTIFVYRMPENEEVVPIIKGRLKIFKRRFKYSAFRVTTQEGKLLVWVRSRGDVDGLGELLGKELAIELRIVEEREPESPVPAGYRLLEETVRYTSFEKFGEFETRSIIYIAREQPELVLRRFKSVSFSTRGFSRKPVIFLEFLPEDAKKFAELTKRNVGERLAVVIDGKVITAPRIQEPMTDGRALIRGIPTLSVARELSELLKLGALPCALGKLKTIQSRTGKDLNDLIPVD